MRLLSRFDGRLTISTDKSVTVPYAILSHTWFGDEDEVSYSDIVDGKDIKEKPGYAKLEFCLDQAAKDGLQHVWIDTCCIDKRNSTELTEAINRMFDWYAASEVCYVFLTDVPYESWHETFMKSWWFTRGWTLQELIAPPKLQFFSLEGQMFGTKLSLADLVCKVTGIDLDQPLEKLTPAERFAWSLKRNTTREEDKSYCMLGILGVAMITFYGENGQRAQDRLIDCVASEHGRPAARQLQRTILQWEMSQELATQKDATQYAEWRSHMPRWTDSLLCNMGEDATPQPADSKQLQMLDAAIASQDLASVTSLLYRRDLQFSKYVLGLALHLAVDSSVPILMALLERGADTTVAKPDDQHNMEPLRVLCSRSQTPCNLMLQGLIEYGEPSEEYFDRNLQAACDAGHTNAVSLLLRCNAEATQKIDSCIGQLYTAVGRDHRQVVDLLLAHCRYSDTELEAIIKLTQYSWPDYVKILEEALQKTSLSSTNICNEEHVDDH